MPKTPPLAPEDAALFREAVGPVEPLTHDRAELRRPAPPPRAAQTRADERAVLRESLRGPPPALDPGEELAYLRDGLPPRVLRRLGRGQYAVQDEIDLHGMSADLARSTIAGFLDEALRAGRSCVRIIHGKGLRSPEGNPVLKAVTDRLLRHHGDVLAFRSAPAAGGGSGAVLVLLRAPR